MYGTKIVVINVKIPYGSTIRNGRYGTKRLMLKMSWYEMVIWLGMKQQNHGTKWYFWIRNGHGMKQL